jgi:flagellar biosynthesis GTPase FlhF
MSETTIRDLFRSLEVTLHERLRTIEDVMRFGGGTGAAVSGTAVSGVTNQAMNDFEKRVEDLIYTKNLLLRDDVHSLRQEVAALRRELAEHRKTAADAAPQLLPQSPLKGIEIVPKRDIGIPDVMSIENRLLLNKAARKALEAKEMGVHDLQDRAPIEEEEEEEAEEEDAEEEVVAEEEEEDAEEEVVAEEEEEAEEEDAEEEAEEEVVTEEAEEEEAEEEVVTEEAEEEEGLEAEEEEAEEETEEEAEEEAEEVELEEFEYKGSTYYRDGEGNVFMTDEDGELMEDPIGIWSEAKQRIVVKKVAA